jgi:hypothetical protein
MYIFLNQKGASFETHGEAYVLEENLLVEILIQLDLGGQVEIEPVLGDCHHE